MHPIAFKLGTVAIHWYGIMVAFGFLVALWAAARRGALDGFTPDQILDLGPWLIVGAIAGARTLYVLTFWREQFADKPFWEVFMIQHGGLVFYGGFIGASLAGILYARLKKLQIWKLFDTIAPSIALGYAFGRIGCLLNGCCYGRACSLPWAITFPPPVECAGTPVHPTQIYESLLGLCLYGGLAWLYRRKKFDGQIFAIYLIVYPLLRSFVEMFRGDYPPNQHFLGGRATPAQLVSIGILLGGLCLLFLLPRTTPASGSGVKQ